MQNNTIYASFIQSNYISEEHGNFELLALRKGDGHLQNNKIKHYWRDTAVVNGQTQRTWHEGAELPTDFYDVLYPAGLIQSDFGSDDHKNFEAVLALKNLLTGKAELWHYYRDNGNDAMDWQRAQKITGDNDEIAGAGCIIQSDFTQGDHGNFEVVVPLKEANGSVALYHYFHDNSDVDLPWTKAQKITGNDAVAGPGCIIQSDYAGDNGHGNFEVVVPLFAAGGKVELWHFFHDNSNVDLNWTKAQKITGNYFVAGPGTFIQSDFTSGSHGNFEVIAPVYVANGKVELWHFFHDNSDAGNPWQRAQLISASANGNACILQGDYAGDNGHGNFEVIMEECAQSLVHYFHPNQDVTYPWLRAFENPITGEQYPDVIEYCDKIIQLTGQLDKDRKYWNGDDNNIPLAYNETETQYNVKGLDLGSSFKHNNKTYFLFGDTSRVNEPDSYINLDCIAVTNSLCAKNGLLLQFGEQPPLISGGNNITQDAFNVPLDGFSYQGNMYVFFSSNHWQPSDTYDQMGRSVLTILTNGEQYQFKFLADFSHDKFINVSVVEQASAERYSFYNVGAGLLIWGSGRYRSSDVYLAFLSYEEVTKTVNGSQEGLRIRFFAGVDANNKPLWSDEEIDAVAMFWSGCIGELCVRYNPFINRYIATYNSSNPNGILLRMSETPWGPWSDHYMLFDGWQPDNWKPGGHKGYGRYMHIGDTPGQPSDKLQDYLITNQDRNASYGGVYGPYQITPYTTGIQNEFTKLYFTMSVWNPYQVMLMYAIIPAPGVPLQKLADEYKNFDPHCNLGCRPFRLFKKSTRKLG